MRLNTDPERSEPLHSLRHSLLERIAFALSSLRERLERSERERQAQGAKRTKPVVPEGQQVKVQEQPPAAPKRKACGAVETESRKKSMGYSVCILHAQNSKPFVQKVNGNLLSSRFAPNDNCAERRPIPSCRPPPFPRPHHRPTRQPF